VFPVFPSAAAPRRNVRRVCAIIAVMAMAAACVQAPMAPPPPAPTAPLPAPLRQTVPTHPLTGEQPGFLKLGNMAGDRPPIRVGILLPFTNGSAATRALAASMMKSAQLALFDAHNPDILLITADEGSTPQQAAAGARTLIAEGAEIIVGPLFAQSATAAAPVARDHGVPIISFSTDSAVAGDGVFLLSFQPGDEVRRIVTYAASQGHTSFAALVPDNAYGDRVAQAFTADVKAAGGRVTDVEKFGSGGGGMATAAKAVATSKPDAILIAQGGRSALPSPPTARATSRSNISVPVCGTIPPSSGSPCWPAVGFLRPPMKATDSSKRGSMRSSAALRPSSPPLPMTRCRWWHASPAVSPTIASPRRY